MPFILGLLVLLLRAHFGLSTATMVAFRNILEMVVFCTILWWNARSLNQLDAHRLQVQQELWQSEQQFRAIFDQTFQFIGLMRPDGTLIEVNQTALDFGGLTPAAVIDQPFWQARWWSISPQIQDRLKEAIAQAASGEFVRYEVDVRGVGDRVVTIDFSIKPVFDDRGNVTLLIPEGRDISDRILLESERKRAKAAVEANERQLREIISKTLDGILILNEQGNVLFANPAAEDIFSCYNLPTLENQNLGIPINLHKSFELDISTNDDFQVIETRIQEINWQGEKAFLAALRDITALKQSAAAIVEDQTDLIVRYLPDSTILYVNEAYCCFFGVNRRDVVGYSYQPLVFAADQERVNQFVESMNTANPTGIIETRMINAKGEVCWTQWVNRMLFDTEGELIDIQAVGRDITDLKQTEAALRESEERWQFALEGSGDGVWDWDLQTNILFYSPRWKAMLGYDDSQVSNSFHEWSDRIHPDHRGAVLTAIEQLQRGDIQHLTQEYRCRHKDGAYIWILDRGRIVNRTPEGQPLRIIGTHSDITLLKQAEAELRRSQISRSLVGDMLRDLQARGSLSDNAMFQAGQELAGRVKGKTLDDFLDAFASMGLGTLSLTQTQPNRWTFSGDQLVSIKPGQDQPTCHYPRGYLCGAIAQLTPTNGQIAAVEMACQSMNDSLCIFVVQVMN